MTRLLVPIHLAVLPERHAGEVYADTALRPADRSGDKPTRQSLHPAPFADRGVRPVGCHLHWALPDALARYSASQHRFPRLPCRWLVVRSAGRAAPAARKVRAWLLPDIHAPTVSPLELPTTIPAIQSGAGLDITGPERSDPGWFAYYDNTLNRLAFHDPLADAPIGPLSYLVCGWYVRTQNDPLAGPVISEAALRQRLAALGWDIRGAVHDLPTATLFHGAAIAIGWPSPGWPGDGGALLAERDQRPTVTAIDAALGDRASAVVGELLGPGDPDAAQLIDLLVGGELHDLGQANGAHLATVNAHRDRFSVATTPFDTDEIVFTPRALAEPGAGAPAGDLDAGDLDQVARPVPRSYAPVAPYLALRGAGRSYRHGEDARFGVLSRLPCRVSGQTVTVLGRPNQSDGDGRPPLPHKAGVLDLPTSVLLPDVRGDIDALLIEIHALDPAINPASAGAGADPLADLRVRWLAAIARRSMPGAPPGDPPPPAHSDGVPPCPLALTLPGRPWYPLHVDWTLDWKASPRGAHDWTLCELDFQPVSPIPDTPARSYVGSARLSATPARLLSDALAATLASLARQPDAGDTIAELVAAFGAADTDDLLFRFTHADLVGAALDGFLDRLRGTPEGTWIARDGMVGAGQRRVAERQETFTANSWITGTFRPGQLRLVDTFGRTLGLPPGAPAIAITGALRHPAEPAVAMMRPRFTAPSTLEFRYISPFATGDLSQADVSGGQTPLTGLLTPSPVDGSLEVHDADGEPLGQLRLGPGDRAIWEPSPGKPGLVGERAERTIGTGTAAQRNLAALVDGIVRADELRDDADCRGSALTTLLRALDGASLVCDASAKAGDQHLQALLGNPVAILRARVRISLDDPQRDRARSLSIPIHLGSIGNLHDGLLCFFLTAAPERLHLIHPALAAAGSVRMRGVASAPDDPISEAQADTSGVVWVDLERDLDLLLLVAPGGDVGLTAGLAPTKTLEMQREWLDRSLSAMTPTLRFDAVLRDPEVVRIPTATDIHGNWSWHHRASPAAWTAERVQQPATGQLDPARTAIAEDGYLRVVLTPDDPYAGIPYRIAAIQRFGPAQTIQRVRVVSPTGRVSDLAIDEAIAMAVSGRFAFFTEVAGFPKVAVLVDATPRGRKYLRTDADQATGNNLGALPTF